MRKSILFLAILSMAFVAAGSVQPVERYIELSTSNNTTHHVGNLTWGGIYMIRSNGLYESLVSADQGYIEFHIQTGITPTIIQILPFREWMCRDVTGDGIVNEVDLDDAAYYFGTNMTGPQSCWRVEKPEGVDIRDLTLIAQALNVRIVPPGLTPLICSTDLVDKTTLRWVCPKQLGG